MTLIILGALADRFAIGLFDNRVRAYFLGARGLPREDTRLPRAA